MDGKTRFDDPVVDGCGASDDHAGGSAPPRGTSTSDDLGQLLADAAQTSMPEFDLDTEVERLTTAFRGSTDVYTGPC